LVLPLVINSISLKNNLEDPRKSESFVFILLNIGRT
jgi:hypothetical protein